jgi:NADH:flavin oxidoreductase / NADH oxidase family
MPSLFGPYDLGPIHLANRMVMAPMTRSSIQNTALAPDGDVALYYTQRVVAGPIVAEGAPVSVQGRGGAGPISQASIPLNNSPAGAEWPMQRGRQMKDGLIVLHHSRRQLEAGGIGRCRVRADGAPGEPHATHKN